MPRLMNFNDLMSIDEAAQYLQVSKGTLYQWRHNGVSPQAIRTPSKRLFYKKDEIHHYLNAIITERK